MPVKAKESLPVQKDAVVVQPTNTTADIKKIMLGTQTETVEVPPQTVTASISEAVKTGTAKNAPVSANKPLLMALSAESINRIREVIKQLEDLHQDQSTTNLRSYGLKITVHEERTARLARGIQVLKEELLKATVVSK
jgi:hypothetical protein